jgi:hypothetical protein
MNFRPKTLNELPAASFQKSDRAYIAMGSFLRYFLSWGNQSWKESSDMKARAVYFGNNRWQASRGEYTPPLMIVYNQIFEGQTLPTHKHKLLGRQIWNTISFDGDGSEEKEKRRRAVYIDHREGHFRYIRVASVSSLPTLTYGSSSTILTAHGTAYRDQSLRQPRHVQVLIPFWISRIAAIDPSTHDFQSRVKRTSVAVSVILKIRGGQHWIVTLLAPHF